MADPVWLGVIYLKGEGGYRIVVKALKHYKKRLKTIGSSPDLKGAAGMFSSLLNQQAAKTVPEIDSAIDRIYKGLGGDSGDACKVAGDVPFIEKALACYKADICKAQDTGHEYFVNLVGDIESARADLEEIESACHKIGIFEGKG